MKLRNPDVRFETTNICNYACVMCPRELQFRKQGVMKFDLFKKVVDELVSKGMKQATLVSFGEPLIDKGFTEKARYAKKAYGLYLYTITTASLLNAKLAQELIDIGFDTVRISYYGTTPDIYEKVHRANMFDQVEKNINNLLELKEKSKSKTPKIEMYWLELDENKHQTEDFKQRWQHRVDDISVWRPHNWSDARTYRELFSEKSTCGRPFNGPVQVQWNGDLVPCCWDYDNKIVLGNAYDNTIEEILKGSEYERLRKAHSEKRFEEFPFCNTCDQLHQVEAEDALVYTTIPVSKVGRTNTNFYSLQDEAGKNAPESSPV